MTIEYVESVRYLCPVCQREWTGAKGAPCEACYAQGWDSLMVEAVKRGAPAQEEPPVLIGKEEILCAGKGCIEPVREEGDLCPECAMADEEYRHDLAEQRAYDMAKDDYYMRKIDEARGK
jgi:transposase-like protein